MNSPQMPCAWAILMQCSADNTGHDDDEQTTSSIKNRSEAKGKIKIGN